MSSYHQKNQQGFNLITTPAICPECGQKTLKYVIKNCKLLDKTKISKLKYLHCENCNSDYFDDDSMEVIQKYRYKSQLLAS